MQSEIALNIAVPLKEVVSAQKKLLFFPLKIAAWVIMVEFSDVNE